MGRFSNLFHMPKGEEVTEHHLRRVLVSSLCSILLCMSCLAGSTWAWFQTTIVNEGNVITIGSVEMSVAMVKGGLSSREAIVPSEDCSFELDEVGTYMISLINTGSIPGYCEIKLTDSNDETVVFYSGTLYPKDSGTDVMDAATITVKIDAEDNYNGVLPVKLKIIPHWGEAPNGDVAAINEEIFKSEEEDEDSDDKKTDSEDPEKLPSAGQTQNPDSTGDNDETQSPDNTEGNGENQNPGATEGDGETQNPGTTEGGGETQNPGTTEGDGESQNPGNTEGDGENQNPGNTEGDGETQNPGNTDGSSETETPGNTDGNGDTETPGNTDGSDNGEDGEEPSGEGGTSENDGDNAPVTQSDTGATETDAPSSPSDPEQTEADK